MTRVRNKGTGKTTKCFENKKYLEKVKNKISLEQEGYFASFAVSRHFLYYGTPNEVTEYRKKALYCALNEEPLARTATKYTTNF